MPDATYVRDISEPLLDRPSGNTAPALAIGYVIHNAARCGNLHARTDNQMVGKSHTTTQHRLVTDDTAARNAAMSRNNTKTADSHVVGDLYEVIDLCTFANDGVVQRTTVDRRIGANLDIVLNDDSAELGNLLQAGGTQDVAETVLPNPHTVMKRHLIADESTLNGYTGAI